VIAGEARLTLDVRHSSDEIRTSVLRELIREAQQISARRGLSVRENGRVKSVSGRNGFNS